MVSIDRIGKEANRWEEQLYLGNDPEAQITYGTGVDDHDRLLEHLREAADRFGRRTLAKAAGVSVREVGAILRGERQATRETLTKLVAAVPQLEAAERERADRERTVPEAVQGRCREVSSRRFAMLAGVRYPRLTEMLAGRRRPSGTALAKLEAAVRQTPSWAAAWDLRP